MVAQGGLEGRPCISSSPVEDYMKYLRLLPLMFVLAGAGAAVSHGADNSAPIVASLGHVGLDGTPWLIYLRVADSNSFIELFPGSRKSSAAVASSSNHLGLFVKDLEATLHALKDRGYPLPADAFEKAAKVEADNTLLYFIKDPDGNRIELSQLRPDSLQVTSRRKK